MAIDFACKKIELDEVVKCSLNLGNAEFRLISFLIKHSNGNFSTQELSERLGLDKSTIQRGVKKLHEKDLLFRSQLNQSVGGYLFLYRIKSKLEVKRKIEGIIKIWNERLTSSLKNW
jgi:predicted transcriptional regulator